MSFDHQAQSTGSVQARTRSLTPLRAVIMDNFTIADKTFTSRLIVGTGKYASPSVMVKAHEASGAEMITVAVRRVNISRPQQGKSCSTTSTRRSISCCRTPPAATRRTKPSGPRGSDARRASRTG